MLAQIDDRALNDAMFYIHAGDRYAEHLESHLQSQRPLKGLSIGKQLAWYTARGF